MQPLQDQFGGVAEVGEKPDVAGGCAQQKSNRIVGVMGHTEGVHCQISDFKRCAGGKEPEIEPHFKLAGNCLAGEAIAIDRNLQPGSQADESLDMIGMLVRDQNAMEVFRCPPNIQQPLADLASAQARIH